MKVKPAMGVEKGERDEVVVEVERQLREGPVTSLIAIIPNALIL